MSDLEVTIQQTRKMVDAYAESGVVSFGIEVVHYLLDELCRLRAIETAARAYLHAVNAYPPEDDYEAYTQLRDALAAIREGQRVDPRIAVWREAVDEMLDALYTASGEGE